MQDTAQKPQAHKRPFFGDDAPVVKSQSAFAPLIDKVGVPLVWIGVGYLLCKMTQKGRPA